MLPILVILTQAPYSSPSNQDALDFILACGNYGFSAAVLLIDDGVYQLEHCESSTDYKIKQPGKVIKSFNFFDVEPIYVCASSIQQRGRSPALPPGAQLVSKDELQPLTDAYSHVVTF
ncbi:DsrE family protein [Alteromonas oceanisediminis]|uniref:DsrE family protein n=1 Tax=Alteromonas oceanisediminis TaxID=2836180 RepID=UPI001BD9261E|nr:DsrE family protein [Alteromonas oceanisediminis]MBT0586339.1 DsrE family protein [Alteromonas oceanisediminis]